MRAAKNQLERDDEIAAYEFPHVFNCSYRRTRILFIYDGFGKTVSNESNEFDAVCRA